MTESARQEIEIPFGGKTYRVRPTWQVLRDVEIATGQPCRKLGVKMVSLGVQGREEASLSEVVAVLSVIIGRESGKSADEIGEMLVDDGYGDLMGPLGTFLVVALRGNKEHERHLAREANKGGVDDEVTERPRIRVKAA